MTFARSMLATSMGSMLTLMAAACGTHRAEPGHLTAADADSGVVTLHGSEADQFTEALQEAGVARRLGDMNMSFVVATKLACVISGATAGSPVCTITQIDGSTVTARASESTTLLSILSVHGSPQGSAHDSVSATATDIRCVNSLSGARGLGTCTFKIEPT